MDNLLESNERTLVLFDSVCSGLSSCLSLVHADIKQMIEHRNRIAQIEQEQFQAKLVSPQELAVDIENTNNNNNNDITHNANTDSKPGCDKNGRRKKSSKNQLKELGSNDVKDDDPHRLAGLKLLDKRLADSFSQAMSMNDLQKSSIVAKHQASMNRPSIFQVLLGKTSKNHHDTNIIESGKKKKNLTSENNNNSYLNNRKEIDNKMIIDDINKQTRLAMQYSKQLEAQLFKVEDLRSKYEMHLKMGLVVKSVAKAYLSTGGTTSASGLGSGSLHYLNNNNDSLACRGQRHHCSSLVINDSSSSMATSGTRSSLSSLNLSTWSSSRSKTNKKRQAAAAAVTADLRINSSGNNGKQTSSFEVEPGQNCYAYSSGIESTLSKSKKAISHSSHSSLKGIKSKTISGDNNSKTTIKEFIENIDRIEEEFESFMGSFLLVIEDIQGFARVCQGDVFEITIKYGVSQKFKTKISVLKDNRQKCDNRQTVFKARIADILAIKAYECKGLGKKVLLGHKLCETRDLFTARSQLMTISLNQTGSIKLNLIVTWNPLHMAPNASAALPGVDISHISLPPTPVSSSTMDSVYQSVDPTYGYYIPPPDYMINDQTY